MKLTSISLIYTYIESVCNPWSKSITTSLFFFTTLWMLLRRGATICDVRSDRKKQTKEADI